MPTLRLGVIPDFREENWLSMDLIAEMLLREIREGHAGQVHAESLCPPFKKRFMRLPVMGTRNISFNADRLLNRMCDYPTHLKKDAGGFDRYHVCDHAYSNVVHALPAERTGVFCHDLDTFRCLFEPEKEARPRWFRAMMRRVLSGLRKAAVVFYTTEDIRRQILARGIVDASRLVKVPLGVSSGYAPDSDPADHSCAVLKKLAGQPYVLHVGSCIARKRIDVLFQVFAKLRTQHAELCLLKVGGPLTREQSELAERLKLGASLQVIDRLGEKDLAGLYRNASVVVQTSDAEGFGLPVAEALASGSVVVASAIPTLMEVGGDAVVYCPVGDVEKWTNTIDTILRNPNSAPTREKRLAQAARYSWTVYARTIVGAYMALSV